MNKSIGVFDSGIGGLTVLKELIKILPNEEYIYIGDNKNCPYGDKTKEELYGYATQIINYLIKRNVKLIVVACNTVNSNVLDDLKSKYDIPIIGVIDATIKDFINRDINSTLVIATNSTISSNVYENKIKSYNKDILVYNLATPKLVPAIENTDPNLDGIIEEYLVKYKNNIDSIILGCTHYKVIEDKIKNILGDVEIISSSVSVADQVYTYLKQNNMLGDSKGTEIYTTGDLNRFNTFSVELLGINSKKLDLER